jgi:hypothetical protein
MILSQVRFRRRELVTTLGRRDISDIGSEKVESHLIWKSVALTETQIGEAAKIKEVARYSLEGDPIIEPETQELETAM